MLYLCYCIDKAEGMKRREEVFIAFEYDYGLQQQQQWQLVQPILPMTVGARWEAAQAQTQRRNETLFDVDAADIEAGSAGAGTRIMKKGTLPLSVLQNTQGRKG